MAIYYQAVNDIVHTLIFHVDVLTIAGLRLSLIYLSIILFKFIVFLLFKAFVRIYC